METSPDISKLAHAVQQIAAGNFSVRVPVSDRLDEFDGLSAGVNMLAEEIERREKDIKDKADRLQKMNEVFIDREHRMMELKLEVDVLKHQVADLQKAIGTLGQA